MVKETNDIMAEITKLEIEIYKIKLEGENNEVDLHVLINEIFKKYGV